MLSYLFPEYLSLLAFIGTLFAFGATCFTINKFRGKLPIDQGKQYAHDGDKSKGKPKGAGLLFIITYVVSVFLFAPLTTEISIYMILVVIEMLTGYFDDASEVPWGRVKKGLLDLLVALGVAFTYLANNPNTITFVTVGKSFTIPEWLYIIGIVALVWMAINVTNCADGVDGLSGTLTCITLMSVYVINEKLGNGQEFTLPILFMVVSILGYLWYNAFPSDLMMGDAGSRAMGIFIAITVLKTGSPFLYFLVSFMLLMDGGLGLLKVFLIKFFHIYIFKNTKLPLHDHVRKTLNWSGTQTVFRFAIVQIVICAATIYMVTFRM